jgi:D-mannonate dehydratase
MMENVHWSSSKVPFILGRFKWNLNCFNRFSINIQISNFMKIRPFGTELFHADRETDGRTDMTKLMVAILQMRLKMGQSIIFSG